MTGVLRLAARPGPLAIDPARTAVIVVDMQNDFGSKGGMFDRAGIDISGIREAIAPTAEVLATARRLSIRIIYLKMGYRADLSDLGAPDSPNHARHLRIFGVGETISIPHGGQGRILIRDTWGTDIVDDLEPQAGDVVIYKTRFSGFYQTELEFRSQGSGYQAPRCRRMHDERMRRVDHPRRLLQRLQLCAADGLRERAHWPRRRTEQP